ncbi:unnamed protein product, partial [Didymodactylos carnosus]
MGVEYNDLKQNLVKLTKGLLYLSEIDSEFQILDVPLTRTTAREVLEHFCESSSDKTEERIRINQLFPIRPDDTYKHLREYLIATLEQIH